MRLFLFIALTFSVVPFACAQSLNDDPGAQFTTATATSTGVLRVQFLNSKSGAAVRPDLVRVNGREVPDAQRALAVVAVPLPSGSYEVEVEAKGFEPFSATAIVDGANTMVQSFELDPKVDAEENEKVEADQGVVVGYVVDALTGLPLNGAKVQIVEKQVEAQSAVDGAYRLQVSLIRSRPAAATAEVALDGERLTLRAEYPGYQPQEQRNLEVLRGQKMTVPVRLEPLGEDAATSEVELLDVAPVRRSDRSREWMFDVSLD